MRLEVTVVGGPGPAGSEQLPATELGLTWPPGCAASGSSMERALRRSRPGHDFTVAGAPLASLVPGVAPLCNGAVVVAWPTPATAATSATAPERRVTDTGAPASARAPQHCAALLVVTNGPGAGAVFELHRGSYTIGRGHCRIRIADPALSRHHCTITVGPHSIALAAAPGSGGVSTYPATPGRGAVRLNVGALITCGSSVFQLRFPDAPVSPALSVSSGASSGGTSDSGGSVPNTGTENRNNGPGLELLDPSALSALEVPHQGGAARGRIATAATALVALVFGVVLAVATGSLMFLAFSAMGAVTMLVPMVGGSSRRKALRQAVARAVEQDVARRGLAFPDAGTLALAARTGADPPGPPGRASSPGLTAPPGRTAGIALRLGTGTRAAAVVLAPNDPGFVPPQVPLLPVCVRLGQTPVQLWGPGAALRSSMHYVLMQLDAASVPVVVLGRPQDLPLAARLLPLTTLAASPAAAVAALESSIRAHPPAGASPSAVLILANMDVGPALRHVQGVAVLSFSELGRQGPTAPSITASAGSVVFTTSGNQVAGCMSGETFAPDGVPASVFANYARSRAASDAASAEGQDSALRLGRGEQGLAANILPGPENANAAQLREGWRSSSGGPLRPVPVGRSPGGALMFDFGRDGPHLLLAGTTGSGKSEFLRTLVGSLAVCHSPADLQFVFMDFKGGAGLGALSKLPHTSSLITDLGGHAMDRTLSSLRAELHRREAALAEAEASGSDEYRAMALARGAGPDPAAFRHTMAHLMIVVDEFRVLVDQFPDAMNELMRLAAVGRSLGIHLVMATQRPQGALSADIRANVTSSICLRVQSSLDSADVIGTAQAATIDVAAPGRAYISRAGSPPEEFQTATLRLPRDHGNVLPLVELAADRLARDARGRAGASAPGQCEGGNADGGQCESGGWCVGEQESDVAALAGLLDGVWRDMVADGHRPAAAVVAQELPPVLAGSDLEAGCQAPAGAAVESLPGQYMTLGLVDVPQGQCLETLRWHPGNQSHLACFGSVHEGSRAVALAAAQSLAANAVTAGQPPTLLYLLDGDGTLAPFASSPWTGACLTPASLRAAARLIQRLAGAVRSDPRMHLLAITDWGRWAAALRGSPWHGAEDDLGELVRFSPPNLVVAVGGGRELLSSSFLAAIPNRMYFSHGSNTESTMLWPRLPRFKPLPGRAAISGPINNFSAGHQGPDDPGTGETLHIAQLAQPPAAGSTGSPGSTGRHTDTARTTEGERESPAPAGMLVVRELPSRLGMAEFRALLRREPRAGGGAAAQRPELLLGIGGDGFDPVSTLLAPGSVLPVLGGPGTGKSAFIRALLELHARARIPVTAAVPTDARPTAYGPGPLPGRQGPAAGMGAMGAMGVIDGVGAMGGRGILLLEDAPSLSPGQFHAATQHLGDGGSIVAVIPHPGPALSKIPLEWGVRAAQQAIVLMPQRPADADLFGVRLDTSGSEPPGRAVLLDRGRTAWFQFPLPEDVREPGFPPPSAASRQPPWA